VAILYCRARDGGYRVDVEGDRYLLHAPGGPFVYTSRRALIAHVTGHPRGRNWTLSRYFRLEDPSLTGDDDPWALLGEPPPRPRAPGINLVDKHLDVRRIFFHGFHPQLAQGRTSAVDPEDSLQDLYVAILSRNRLTGGFDPKRSTMSHYVHLVSRTVLYQNRRKQNRWNREVLSTDERNPQEEVASSAPSALDTSIVEGLVHFLKNGEGDEVARAAELLTQGCTEKEVASKLGLSSGDTKRLVLRVRERAREWLETR